MTAANFRRAIAALFVFAGAQLVLFQQVMYGRSTAAPQLAQSSTPRSQTPQSRKETIHNPLNDYLDEAQRDIDKNDFTAAVTPLQKFIAEKPDVAYAHFQLAYTYTALKQVPEARAEYEKAISLDPKMTEAYLNLGILLTDPAPADAVAPLKKAVELLPAQSRPRILLGVAQERAGDFASAANSFEGAVNLDPRDTEATLHLARLYLKLKRPADAESKFRALVNADPNSTVAALGLAQTLDAEGKPEAADAYRKYLALQPGDEFVGGLLRAGDRCFELRRGRGDIRMLTTLQRAHRERARGQRAERARLTAQFLRPIDPQVPSIAVLEILPGLVEQRRNGSDQ